MCELALNQMATETDEYHEGFVSQDVHCPVCGVPLTEYRIPVDKLWVWPGGFYNPMIALDIFCVLDAPKGEIHRHNEVCHIWTGVGKHREEKLVRLLGKNPVSKRVEGVL